MQEENHFRFQDRFFTQKDGAPMGSPLSPIVAEVFMEHLEEKTFNTCENVPAPPFLERHMDDIFALMLEGTSLFIYEELTGGRHLTYGALKEALLQRFAQLGEGEI
uniref:Reverse transcriptase domain-containing protein n=1 Tax=Trichuris muris TaxID=70415 RepID=A0A5S6QJX9_TRIMR